MEFEKPVLSASLTRTIVIPLLITYGLHIKQVSLEIFSAPGLTAVFIFYFIFLITCNYILYKNIHDVEDDPEIFLSKSYHSRILRGTMGFYLALLKQVTRIIFKPLKFLVMIGIFGFPILWLLGVMRPEFQSSYQLIVTFCVAFIFCELFLTPHEETLLNLVERSRNHLMDRRANLVKFVYSMDYQESLVVPSLPKDLIPSALYYVSAFGKIILFHLLNVLIYLKQKFHLKKIVLIFIPFVQLFDLVTLGIVYLILGLYLVISFGLRYGLWLGFGGLFFYFLYLNVKNLSHSVMDKSLKSFLSSMGTTALCFIALEMLRHLLLNLPLRLIPSKGPENDSLQVE